LKKATKEQIKEIKQKFIHNYKDSVTELKFKNDYELLVSIILSAQCTDKRVNIITPELFRRYKDIESLSNAKLQDVKDIIKSCSFFNNKAKNIISMANRVKEKFQNKIPNNQKDLISLSGVGIKTANVFLIEFYGQNYMAVDTHVFRVSHRLGLSYGKTVLQTQDDLTKILKDDLGLFHQSMVLFGRYICKAVKPDCQNCLFDHLCQTTQSFKPS